jgi:hypothetical protein
MLFSANLTNEVTVDPSPRTEVSGGASKKESAHMRTVRVRATPLALLAAAATCLLGCPDPQQAFDDFAEREAANRKPPVEVACGTAVDSVEGKFVFALATQISTKLPVLFIADLTTEDDGLHMTVTALAAADRKTLVGDPTDLGPFPIDPENGKFTAALPELTVDGKANPLTKDKPIVATITLTGAVCEDAVCGDARGQVTAPIELKLEEGSTFYMERLPDDGTIPEPPVVNCAGDVANPVPGA